MLATTMHSSLKTFLFFTAALMFSIKSYTQSIFGVYESNWRDSLIIYSDSSFKISNTSTDTFNVKVHYELTGKLAITKKYVTFTTFNESNDKSLFWSCHSLKRKAKKLIRPLHCEPTHRFLVFQKKE